MLAVPGANCTTCCRAGRARQVRRLPGVSIDRIFLVFSAVVGGAIGVALVMVPQARALSLPPYFWVLIAFALFEAAAVYLRGQGVAPPIAMATRLIGFAIALALMVLIPLAAGVPLKLV